LSRPLHQHVENLALVIDGAPQVHSLSGDADHHLVQVPPVAWSWAQGSKSTGEPRPELQSPAAHRLVGNIQAPLGQKLLDVALAQGKPEIKPDRVLDDRRREAVAPIGERGHFTTLADRPLPSDPVAVTKPRNRGTGKEGKLGSLSDNAAPFLVFSSR